MKDRGEGEKEELENEEIPVDTEGELQSQQATLQGNKTTSQISTLTSKPKHERCVHFHSHYKPQIYFKNTGTLFRAGKLQRQTVSVAFQRQPVFDGILMLSGFGGFHSRALKSGNNDRMQLTQLTTGTSTQPLSFFRTLAQG